VTQLGGRWPFGWGRLYQSRWTRVVLAVGSAGLLSMLMLSVRTLTLGAAAMVESERAFDRGDLLSSLAAAQRAASLRVPLASHVDEAMIRIAAIGTGAEAAGQPELARRSWEVLRGVAIDLRSPSARTHASLAERHLAARGSSSDGKAAVAGPMPTLAPVWRVPLLWGTALLLAVGATQAVRSATNDPVGMRWAGFGFGLTAMAAGALLWSLVLYASAG
jgi:hypothetical protein